MHLGRTILRCVAGPLMIGHGTQKLFGWFDGHRLEGAGAIASLAAAAAGSWLATDRFTEPEPQLEREPRFERRPAEAPADAEVG